MRARLPGHGLRAYLRIFARRLKAEGVCCTAEGLAQPAPRLMAKVQKAQRREADKGRFMAGDFTLGLASLQRETAAGRGLPPVEERHPPHLRDNGLPLAR